MGDKFEVVIYDSLRDFFKGEGKVSSGKGIAPSPVEFIASIAKFVKNSIKTQGEESYLSERYIGEVLRKLAENSQHIINALNRLLRNMGDLDGVFLSCSDWGYDELTLWISPEDVGYAIEEGDMQCTMVSGIFDLGKELTVYISGFIIFEALSFDMVPGEDMVIRSGAVLNYEGEAVLAFSGMSLADIIVYFGFPREAADEICYVWSWLVLWVCSRGIKLPLTLDGHVKLSIFTGSSGGHYAHFDFELERDSKEFGYVDAFIADAVNMLGRMVRVQCRRVDSDWARIMVSVS